MCVSMCENISVYGGGVLSKPWNGFFYLLLSFSRMAVVTRARLFHSQLVRNTLIIKCLFDNKGHKEKPAMTTMVMPPSPFLTICASK